MILWAPVPLEYSVTGVFDLFNSFKVELILSNSDGIRSIFL
jgi:hypothetical protein